ncbi:acetyl-CoA carboxylase biotin carboxyl carrier protein [Paraburkholderia terrae]|uniref:Acetyl-CoA carboxylase biotin carboxyl carrier protein subunit n=1 Tax=Paraburkholderia terrae TaxID=311230 RepID=A0A2I8EYA6_9BURK|nr:biotin/lipoyl-containing protein [Paraburkholderia terrae]AUT64479.1 acetyl-CoA carboxylase biotin carboxyl carrier protein subunit [Paraburkholderia terrae]
MTQTIEVDLDEIRQITSWLAASNVGFIEVSRPGATVRLKVDDGHRHDERRARPSPKLSASADARGTHAQAVNVTAATAGVFLAAHPARSTPLVEAGARVGQGDVIGLLQIAQLCMPVVASTAGVLTRTLAAHGATVGYGTPLFEIVPGR